MPSARATHELIRLLHDTAQPVYMLDDRRRIVFLNSACSQWVGVPADDLLGRQCSYSSAETDPASAAADALCPPPEVFHGRRTMGNVAKKSADGATVHRRAEFLPLLDESNNCVGVLTFVEPNDVTVEDTFPDSNGLESSDEARRLHESVALLRKEMAQWHHVERLAGRSAAMQRVRNQVEMGASGRGTVLIVGPPGIGRQHVARTIHFAQQATAGPLFPVACSTLPADVLRSNIAGLLARHGRAENNSVATLLLADVHLLPPELHAEMMRWVDECPKNIRIIATTIEPLEDRAQRGEFPAGLAKLLSTLVIELPELATRRDDIPLVAQMLLEEFNAQGGKQLRGFSSEALDRLAAYDWPGQMAELAAAVHEACGAAEGFEVVLANLPKRLQLAADAARFSRKPPEPIDLEKFLAGVETELIQRALREAKGNKSKAARLLGMTRPKLYRRMVQLGLEGADDATSAED